MTTYTVTLGAMFFDDHASRFPEYEPFIEVRNRSHGGKRVHLALTEAQAVELLSDARFYATEARYMDCPELGVAAKRVADALTKAGVVIPRCEWFAMCTNNATATRPHPVLGDVPVCSRCNAKADAIEAGTR